MSLLRPLRRTVPSRRALVRAAAAAACVAWPLAEASGADSVAVTATPSQGYFTVPGNVGELLAPVRSDEEPFHIRIGSFLLLNKAGVTTAYDDNIFARPTNREGDYFTNTDAQVRLVSDWSRHALELAIGGGGNFYAEHESENTGYANAGFASRIDVVRGTWIRTHGKYAVGFEPRGAGDSFQPFEEPIETQTFEGGMLVHAGFARLWTEVAGLARHQQFFDARLVTGGRVTTVDQSYRDGTVTDAVGRLGYEFSPKTSAFIESAYERRDYDDRRFDADGAKVLAGIRKELTRLVEAEVAIGYMTFDTARALADIDTWTYRAQVVYAISPLVALGLAGSREVGTPSQSGTGSNRVESEIGVRADYAIRRDVSLMAGAGFGWVDYVDIARHDEYLRLATGVEYEWRPWLLLWASYAYIQHDSNQSPDIDYDKNLLRVGLQARY